MKNSINNLKTQLTSREKLSIQQLFAIKGGDGEDIRRDEQRSSSFNINNSSTTTITTTPTTTTTTTVSTTSSGK